MAHLPSWPHGRHGPEIRRPWRGVSREGTSPVSNLPIPRQAPDIRTLVDQFVSDLSARVREQALDSVRAALGEALPRSAVGPAGRARPPSVALDARRKRCTSRPWSPPQGRPPRAPLLRGPRGHRRQGPRLRPLQRGPAARGDRARAEDRDRGAQAADPGAGRRRASCGPRGRSAGRGTSRAGAEARSEGEGGAQGCQAREGGQGPRAAQGAPGAARTWPRRPAASSRPSRERRSWSGWRRLGRRSRPRHSGAGAGYESSGVALERASGAPRSVRGAGVRRTGAQRGPDDSMLLE